MFVKSEQALLDFMLLGAVFHQTKAIYGGYCESGQGSVSMSLCPYETWVQNVLRLSHEIRCLRLRCVAVCFAATELRRDDCDFRTPQAVFDHVGIHGHDLRSRTTRRAMLGRAQDGTC